MYRVVTDQPRGWGSQSRLGGGAQCRLRGHSGSSEHQLGRRESKWGREPWSEVGSGLRSRKPPLLSRDSISHGCFQFTGSDTLCRPNPPHGLIPSTHPGGAGSGVRQAVSTAGRGWGSVVSWVQIIPSGRPRPPPGSGLASHHRLPGLSP